MVEQHKVLLVDDELDFCEVVREVLEGSGYAVAVGHSGKDAREMAVSERPDVIVLDVMMETDTAGFEAARWLREQDSTKRIPIVMLTAVNQEYPFNFAPDEVWLPVDAFLDKPVSPEQLLEEVERATS